jgi:hypothetical protein
MQSLEIRKIVYTATADESLSYLLRCNNQKRHDNSFKH